MRILFARALTAVVTLLIVVLAALFSWLQNG
jgi:hypothetical protein